MVYQPIMILSPSLVLLGACVVVAGGNSSIRPADPRLQYEGRWRFAADGSVAAADWPCSGVSFRVNSTVAGGHVSVAWLGVRTRVLATVSHVPAGGGHSPPSASVSPPPPPAVISSTLLLGPAVEVPGGGEPQHDRVTLPSGVVDVRLRKLTQVRKPCTQIHACEGQPRACRALHDVPAPRYCACVRGRVRCCRRCCCCSYPCCLDPCCPYPYCSRRTCPPTDYCTGDPIFDGCGEGTPPKRVGLPRPGAGRSCWAGDSPLATSPEAHDRVHRRERHRRVLRRRDAQHQLDRPDPRRVGVLEL
jgi:hypothetical protein